MDTTFKYKFDQCGVIFPSSFRMIKRGSIYQYKQGCEFQFSYVFMSLLFQMADGTDTKEPTEKENFHFDDRFQYAYNAFKYTLAHENIEAQEKPLLVKIVFNFDLRQTELCI